MRNSKKWSPFSRNTRPSLSWPLPVAVIVEDQDNLQGPNVGIDESIHAWSIHTNRYQGAKAQSAPRHLLGNRLFTGPLTYRIISLGYWVDSILRLTSSRLAQIPFAIFLSKVTVEVTGGGSKESHVRRCRWRHPFESIVKIESSIANSFLQ